MRTIFILLLLAFVLVSCIKEETDYTQIDKKIIENYLISKGLTAEVAEKGLYYIIEKPGGANHPTQRSKVSVKYKGYLVDGTVFDQSYSGGQPASFNLSGVISGWRIGIPFIGIGGKIKLFVPSNLGYGATAQPKIPAHSVLIFDVELVDFY